MEVIQFHGKIFYPLTCDPGTAEALLSKTIVNQKGKTVSLFRKADFTMEEMRPGLGDLLDGSCPNSIGSICCLERREALNLPKLGQRLTFVPRQGDSVPLTLGNVGFVVFETGVCFLEMDVSMAGFELETVMNTAYYLCEVKDKANHFTYDKVIFDPATKTKSTETVSFSLKEFFLNCAAYITNCGHFEDKPLASATAKPLLYSYYLLPERPENYESLTSNIAQNYKLSYKGLEDQTHTLQTFRNSAWCVSANGAANVTYQVDDAATNDFFATTFLHKWKSEYLFLFLNVIHQKYAILKSLGALSAIHFPEGDYKAMQKELLRVQATQDVCENLKLRCFFDLPSRIEHVNRVYRFFQIAFQVPSYLHSLNKKLTEASTIAESCLTKVKDIREKEHQIRSDQLEIKVALLTALVTCLTFFKSFYSTLLSLIHWDLDSISLDTLVLTITFIATISAAIGNIAKKREEIKNLRIQIQKLKIQSGQAPISE